MNRLTKAQMEFMNGYVPATIHDIYDYQEGGVAQGNQGNDKMMKMIQTYAQIVAQQSGEDPNKVYQELMGQLQQMKPEQQQAAMQEIVKQVQTVSQQPAMQMGGDPSQMQQAPDEQQLVQQIQQMLEQGVEPQEIIAQLLQSQVDPQMVVEIFVQLGMPQEQVVQAVQTVMQQMGGGQEQEVPQEQGMEEPVQESMAYGGAAKYPYGGIYADKKYYGDFLPQDAFNNAMTDINMLAVPAATMAASGVKALRPVAGIMGAAGALAGSIQGYRGLFNKDAASTPKNPITKAQATNVYNTYGKPGAGTQASNMWDKYGKTQKMYGQYMKDGGTPDNPGFNALPEYVQDKILANMQTGGPYKIKDERGEAFKVSDNTRVAPKLKVSDLKKLNVRNKTEKEIAAERKATREKADANVLNQGLNMLKPEYNTRENWAETAQALESRFRVSDKPNFFDDYLNPANMVGNMASSLGQAPLQAQQSNSYLPYITAIGAPLTAGALAGIGARGTKQFVNNLVNPAAGINLKNLPSLRKGTVKGEIPKTGNEFINAIDNIDGNKVFYDNTATQNFPTGEWKYMDEMSNKGGISEVAPFNAALDEQIVKATYGKRPLVSPEQIYTEKEIAEIVKKRKQYNDALKQYGIDNPEDGVNFMEILSGQNSYMDRFHNLHPNLEFPGFGDKFTTDSFLMKQNQPRSWRINPLSGDTTLKSAEGLDTSKNWYHRATPKDYVSEHRGSLGLSLDDIKNMSEDELKKIAEKKFKQINQHYTERFKKDIETPFTGKEAFKNLNPNKYGGLTKAQFGIPGNFDFNNPFGMQTPRFGQTANNADTRSYPQNNQNPYIDYNKLNNFSIGPGINDNASLSYGDPYGADGVNREVLKQTTMTPASAYGTGVTPYSKTNIPKTNNKTIKNVSGRQMANNALLNLSIANYALGESGPRPMSKRQTNQQREANMLSNPLNYLGVNTTNVQGGGNQYLPNRYDDIDDYGTRGNVIAKTGGQMNFAAGGQYKVSHDQLLQLLRDGAEIEFL
jgi:hypothetical protein